MISYRATLDVPRELAQFTAKLLWAERRRLGTESNEFSRAFCGRLSRSSGRRVSTHGTWSFRRPI